MKNILVLFDADWDRLQLEKAARDASGNGVRLHFEGFDLFSFPSNARLLWFDILAFVDRLAKKYGCLPLHGVTSSNEQFGALAAALLAERLGLPGTDPNAVIAAQHKYIARRIIGEAVPEANIPFAAFPYTFRSAAEVGLAFPCFVKPVKAAYSVLARRVDRFEDLQAHMRFHPWEKYIIKRLVRPFNDVVRRRTAFDVDAHWMLAEELVDGLQINVDGAAVNGKVHILGVVDAVMYPGTDQFMRFEYPSRLPAGQLANARDSARRIIEALGIGHGLFNVEMRVCRSSGHCKLIEVNPRMAAQFSDLYEKVDGINLHALALELAAGEAPDLRGGRGKYAVATSFVFRKFDGTTVARTPSSENLQWLREFDPDAFLALFIKTGGGLKREMKWLGSHRYATLNMGAESEPALMEKYRLVKERFGFEAG
ncbi:MAG TPA: ATP-grasp domain-containing protein [Usitatibacteraceae bacterium]|nr:ATP-grasp domain-containing protein [Usitatibacteraceae bacterium]